MKGQDFSEMACVQSGGFCRFSTTLTNWPSLSANVTFSIINDDEYEGGPTGTPETFTLRLIGNNNLGAFTYDVELRIVDDDSPPPVAKIGYGAHAVARAEALVDNQPRLVPTLRNPGARASEFTLRASDGGVDASGGFQAETIWGATSLSRTSDGFGEHEHLLATLGAHFRMSERLHLGGMLQFDRYGAEPDGASDTGEIHGQRMVGRALFRMAQRGATAVFRGKDALRPVFQ